MVAATSAASQNRRFICRLAMVGSMPSLLPRTDSAYKDIFQDYFSNADKKTNIKNTGKIGHATDS